MAARARLTIWDVVLSVVVLVLLGGATWFGLGTNAINGLVLLWVPIAVIVHLVRAYRRQLDLGFVRRPLAREHRAALVQCLVRIAFVVVWLGVLRVGVIRAQLGDAYGPTLGILAAALAAVAVHALIPTKRVPIAQNVVVLLVTLFWGSQLAMALVPPSASAAVVLDPPFRSEMVVAHGGLGMLVNHHFVVTAQRHALDMFVLDNGVRLTGDPRELASYACFGRAVYAPADGTIARVADGRADLPIGSTDAANPVGNHVVIEVAVDRYVLLAHLRRGSIVVHEGDHVRCGELLAECGNSGNTSEPHLHVQVQSHVDIFTPGTVTVPFAFRNAVRMRDAEQPTQGDGSHPLFVRRNDRLIATATACR